MLRTINLGDSLTTAAVALTAYPVSDLDDVYVTIDSTGIGVATATVQYSVDGGVTWRTFSSSSMTAGTKVLVGPLPPCHLIRGNTTAHGTGGTISYRAGGNVKRYLALPVGEVVCGNNVDIDATPTSTTVAASVAGCGTPTVFLSSSNFYGTYAVRISFDGGSTWGTYATSAALTLASFTTYSHTPPRCTHVIVVATTNTSGTLVSSYSASKEAQV